MTIKYAINEIQVELDLPENPNKQLYAVWDFKQANRPSTQGAPCKHRGVCITKVCKSWKHLIYSQSCYISITQILGLQDWPEMSGMRNRVWQNCQVLKKLLSMETHKWTGRHNTTLFLRLVDGDWSLTGVHHCLGQPAILIWQYYQLIKEACLMHP